MIHQAAASVSDFASAIPHFAELLRSLLLQYHWYYAGHTFVPKHEVFLPKYQLDPAEMAVSVVNANEATYRTVYFENVGPTPIMFDLDHEHSGLVIAALSGGVR